MVAKVLGLSAGGLIGAGLAAYLFSKFELDLDPKIKETRAKQNPIKIVTLDISLDEVEEETRVLIAETLHRHDSFEFEWNLSGWTPWSATHFKNNSTKSSVGYAIYGLSNPDSETKVLRLWALQSEPGNKTLATYDWRGHRPGRGLEFIIRGFSRADSPYCRVIFNFPDGSMLAIDLVHSGTELVDQFHGGGKMRVHHSYKVRGTDPPPYPLRDGIYLRVPLQDMTIPSQSTLGNIIL